MQFDVAESGKHNLLLMRLDEFEYLVTSSAAGLGDGAHGAAIRREPVRPTGSGFTVDSLFTTLRRLEQTEFVPTWMDRATTQNDSHRLVLAARGDGQAVQLSRHHLEAAAAVQALRWQCGGRHDAPRILHGRGRLRLRNRFERAGRLIRLSAVARPASRRRCQRLCGARQVA